MQTIRTLAEAQDGNGGRIVAKQLLCSSPIRGIYKTTRVHHERPCDNCEDGVWQHVGGKSRCEDCNGSGTLDTYECSCPACLWASVEAGMNDEGDLTSEELEQVANFACSGFAVKTRNQMEKDDNDAASDHFMQLAKDARHV